MLDNAHAVIILYK